MPFARWVFRIAGVYGLLVLVPQLFMAERIGRDFPPPLTHLEFFYGFVGVALAWQVAFLIIASDPPRYRPFMLAGVIEKFSFTAATALLFSRGELAAPLFAAGLVDGLLGVLFIVSWLKTGRKLDEPSAQAGGSS